MGKERPWSISRHCLEIRLEGLQTFGAQRNALPKLSAPTAVLDKRSARVKTQKLHGISENLSTLFFVVYFGVN